jgi:hypothetical protein
MVPAQRPRAGTSQEGRRIGLAWMTDRIDGHEVIWHNGETGGYASFIGFTGDRRRGIVVLANVAKNVDDVGVAWLVPPMQQRVLPD